MEIGDDSSGDIFFEGDLDGYCGGLCLVIPTEFGDPVLSLALDQRGITIGTARGRIVGVRLERPLSLVSEQSKKRPKENKKEFTGKSIGSQRKHVKQTHHIKDKIMKHGITTTETLKQYVKKVYWPYNCTDPLQPVAHGVMPPTYGPGSLVHNHIPYCHPPRHNWGLYAAHSYGPIRFVYETQKKLYAVMNHNWLYVFDRHNNTKPTDIFPLGPKHSVEPPHAYVIQEYTTPWVIILTTFKSSIVNVKTREIHEISMPIPDAETVPLDFNGDHLLVARNIVNARSIRIYKTNQDLHEDKPIKGWLSKPSLVMDIPLKAGYVGPACLWGRDRVVVSWDKMIVCYDIIGGDYTHSEANTAVFSVHIDSVIKNIQGNDLDYLWVLTEDSKLYQFDGEGLYQTFDLLPATLVSGYPVKARTIRCQTDPTARYYAFTADNGVFLVALNTLKK